MSSKRQCILQGRMMTEVGFGTHRDDQSPCCSEGRGERAPEARVSHLLCPVSFFKLRLIRHSLISSFCKGFSPSTRISLTNLAAASPAQPRPEESSGILGLQRFPLQTSEEKGRVSARATQRIQSVHAAFGLRVIHLSPPRA